MRQPSVEDGATRLYHQLKDALADLSEARQAAAAGEDAMRAVALLRGVLGLVKESIGKADLDPYWQMAELLLDSVPVPATTTTPATTSGSAR
jgi:hypothetical protein